MHPIDSSVQYELLTKVFFLSVISFFVDSYLFAHTSRLLEGNNKRKTILRLATFVMHVVITNWHCKAVTCKSENPDRARTKRTKVQREGRGLRKGKVVLHRRQHNTDCHFPYDCTRELNLRSIFPAHSSLFRFFSLTIEKASREWLRARDIFVGWLDIDGCGIGKEGRKTNKKKRLLFNRQKEKDGFPSLCLR